MNPLDPEPPFVWPEPRVLAAMTEYGRRPPYERLALEARSAFGIVLAPTSNGVEAIESWLQSNPALRLSFVFVVYPTCPTRQEHLAHALNLIERDPERLKIRMRALKEIPDRATSALCFMASGSDTFHLAVGAHEDLGLNEGQGASANFLFPAQPVLVEAFKRYFDWMWANACELTSERVAGIPHLVIPPGTEEAARMWREYRSVCSVDQPQDRPPDMIACVDPGTGDVALESPNGEPIEPPTETLGLKKLDPLSELIARLYAKGELVSIDKLSRIPPLDAPLDPSLFGDAAEIHRGNVVRKVSMRVSIIDEKTLKEINKRRQGLRSLLTRFTFGLADNMRWMPSGARNLFDSELKRLNEEGKSLISDLLKGDVAAFIDGKRQELTADLRAMYTELERPGQVTGDDIERVVANLRARLEKAKSANFMPTLSFSQVSFAWAETATASPWGQAYSLLADVAAFPRKALTDSFFFRGLKVSDDDLIEAMNVADDALWHDRHSRGIKERCTRELALLARIEKTPMESRHRCELVARMFVGDSEATIDEALKRVESA